MGERRSGTRPECRRPNGVRMRCARGPGTQAQPAAAAQGGCRDRRGGGHPADDRRVRRWRPRRRPTASSSPRIGSGRSPTPSAMSRTRLGIAGSAAAGSSPTMGYLGGPGFPDDPTDLGPLVPLPGGWRELFEFLGRSRLSPRSSSPATARTPATPAAPRRTRRPAGSRPPNPGRPTWPTAAPCVASSTSSAWRPIGNHGFIPGHLVRPEQRRRHHVDQRLRAVPDRARVRVHPGHAVPGHGQRPDERQQPRTSSRGPSPARSGKRSTSWPRTPATSRCTRTTTRRPTTSCRTARWSKSPVDRATGNPLPAPVQVRGESGKRLMEYYLDDHRSEAVRHRARHLLGARRAAPAPLVLRPQRQPGRERLRPARVRRRPDQAVPALPRQGRRPERSDAGRASATATASSRSGPVTSTSPRSSGARVPRAGTTPTTSRTARPVVVAIPASPCVTPSFSAANLTSLRG